ncbi:MAG: lipid kinase [Gammaproteobacteria bacterium]|nr:lipid kinase [Gammaproteobacteria bacterium]
MATGSRVGAEPEREVLLVVNRRARSGDSAAETAFETLDLGVGEPRILDIEDPATLSARIQAALTPATAAIVIAGGDGTVNSALPALIEAAIPLGIIPLGTGNDLARTLGIPTTAAEAAEVVARGRKRRIDVGSVNGRYFVNAAGIGFSTELQELPPRLKGWLGPLAYPLGVLRRWRDHRAFRVKVRGGGIDCARRVIQVTVANGRSYGGGMTVHEEARVDDGTLDVLLILPRPLWRLILSALSFKRGVYSKRGPVIALRGAEFEIRTRRPNPVATDGEVSTSTPAEFRVIPGALEVYVPDDAA